MVFGQSFHLLIDLVPFTSKMPFIFIMHLITFISIVTIPVSSKIYLLFFKIRNRVSYITRSLGRAHLLKWWIIHRETRTCCRYMLLSSLLNIFSMMHVVVMVHLRNLLSSLACNRLLKIRVINRLRISAIRCFALCRLCASFLSRVKLLARFYGVTFWHLTTFCAYFLRCIVFISIILRLNRGSLARIFSFCIATLTS